MAQAVGATRHRIPVRRTALVAVHANRHCPRAPFDSAGRGARTACGADRARHWAPGARATWQHPEQRHDRYAPRMSVETASPNAANVQFWNDVLVDKFERFRSLFVEASDIHSRGPLERAGLRPGMRALDVGCGFGETSLQIAEL